MRLNPKDKIITNERMEKWVVRKAFESYLPESAWRQKEQFSDGVGYSWIDTLKALVKKNNRRANGNVIIASQLNLHKIKRSFITEVYLKITPARPLPMVPSVPSVACSTLIAPEWDEAFKNQNDPSGRAVSKVHEEAYK